MNARYAKAELRHNRIPIMYLESIHTVFIHVPKTGGNYCESVFLDMGLTNDVKTVQGSGQDGTQRFGISGKFSKYKHQDLRGYHNHFRGGYRKYLRKGLWDSLEVVTVWRDPLERLVSHYLSPHRHTSPDGSINRPSGYDLEEFRDLTQRVRSATQMLELPEANIPKSVQYLLFSQLANDLELFLALKGYSSFPAIGALNESSNAQLAREMLDDSRIRHIVFQSHHVADMELLGK